MLKAKRLKSDEWHAWVMHGRSSAWVKRANRNHCSCQPSLAFLGVWQPYPNHPPGFSLFVSSLLHPGGSHFAPLHLQRPYFYITPESQVPGRVQFNPQQEAIEGFLPGKCHDYTCVLTSRCLLSGEWVGKRLRRKRVK